jgi:hypothetical protein
VPTWHERVCGPYLDFTCEGITGSRGRHNVTDRQPLVARAACATSNSAWDPVPSMSRM